MNREVAGVSVRRDPGIHDEDRAKGRTALSLPAPWGRIHFVGIGGIGMSGIAEILIEGDMSSVPPGLAGQAHDGRRMPPAKSRLRGDTSAGSLLR